MKNIELKDYDAFLNERKNKLYDYKKFHRKGKQMFEDGADKLSDLQKKYRDFFKNKLKSYKVDSPAELPKEDRTKFFNEIKKEWPKEKEK